jgi:hypothetical protein
MSGSFRVNQSYSGSVVLKKKINYITLFLHFCDYLPFEEVLTLYLGKKTSFLFTQGWFILSLIEIDLLVVENFKKIWFSPL